MLNNFDSLEFRKFGHNRHITYGIVKGRGCVVFIKSGLRGSAYGPDNRYLKLARHLNDMCGCAVVCSSNPSKRNQLAQGIAYCQEKFPFLPVYYVGLSSGAVMALKNAYKYPAIKQVIAFNPEVPMNARVLAKGAEKLRNRPTVVYGDKDESFKRIKRLFDMHADFKIIHGQNHLFEKPQYTQFDTVVFQWIKPFLFKEAPLCN